MLIYFLLALTSVRAEITAYLDEGYAGGDSDGTLAKPSVTYAAAVALFIADTVFTLNVIGAWTATAALLPTDASDVSIKGIIADGTATTAVCTLPTAAASSGVFINTQSLTFDHIDFDGLSAIDGASIVIMSEVAGALTLTDCKFIRTAGTASACAAQLIVAVDGTVTLTRVSCLAAVAEVLTFSVCPISITTAGAVVLDTVSLSYITVDTVAFPVVEIAGASTAVTVKACTFTTCVSALSTTGGAVRIESSAVCTLLFEGINTFVTCAATAGEAGGLYVKLTSATATVTFPAAATDFLLNGTFVSKEITASNAAGKIAVVVYVDTAVKSACFTQATLAFAKDWTGAQLLTFFVVTGTTTVVTEDIVAIANSAAPTTPTSIYVGAAGADANNGSTAALAVQTVAAALELLDTTKLATLHIVNEIDAVKRAFAAEFGVKFVGHIYSEASQQNTAADVAGVATITVTAGIAGVAANDAIFGNSAILTFEQIKFVVPDTITGLATDAAVCLIASTAGELTLKTCTFSIPHHAIATPATICQILLLAVTGGAVTLEAVTKPAPTASNAVTDVTSFATTPIDLKGATIAINGLTVKNVYVTTAKPVLSIADLGTGSVITIEGLVMDAITSPTSTTASALEIKTTIAATNVSIGQTTVCSFANCASALGQAGAIFISMATLKGHLTLPAAGKLTLANNTITTATVDVPTHIFILGSDLVAFCSVATSFPFAMTYTADANANWIKGKALAADTEAVDVYEAYVKAHIEAAKAAAEVTPEEDDGMSTGTLVAIIVPIVVVVIVVVIIVIVCIVRRKKSSTNKVDVDTNQEGGN